MSEPVNSTENKRAVVNKPINKPINEPVNEPVK